MRTAGELIRQTRLEKNLTKSQLGEMTHIKTGFIEAIENSNWEALPEIAVVIGFVKSISHFLDIDETTLVALLKREYKPADEMSKQKKIKGISKHFVWGPRLTFVLIVLVLLIAVFGYLGFQYKKFNSPPKLEVTIPVQNQIVTSDKLTVAGMTDPDATVEVNNQLIVVDDGGTFSAQISVTEDTKVIKIIAKSRSGKETTVSRTIEFQP